MKTQENKTCRVIHNIYQPPQKWNFFEQVHFNQAFELEISGTKHLRIMIIFRATLAISLSFHQPSELQWDTWANTRLVVILAQAFLPCFFWVVATAWGYSGSYLLKSINDRESSSIHHGSVPMMVTFCKSECSKDYC